MHLIIHTIPVKPNTLEQAKALFEAKIPTLAGRFTAWRGARLCVTGDQQLVAVGMWADEAQMQEFLTQPAFEQTMAAFSEFFAGPPSAIIARELTAVGPAA